MPSLTQAARTRSVLTPTHLLHTSESFVRTPLPPITHGLGIVHAAPVLGAGFLCFTAELPPAALLGPSEHQRFLYVLSGAATLQHKAPATPIAPHPLRPGSFAFVPPGQSSFLAAETDTRVLVLDKPYEPLPFVPAPTLLVGHESEVPTQPLAGDPALEVRTLLPPGPSHDFAVNTMHYAPGAALPQIEVHYMEHGLLMLEGEGLYLLNDTWYPVQAGDFIWMAPFCPQQFIASTPGARYLIYKNFNRLPQP